MFWVPHNKLFSLIAEDRHSPTQGDLRPTIGSVQSTVFSLDSFWLVEGKADSMLRKEAVARNETKSGYDTKGGRSAKALLSQQYMTHDAVKASYEYKNHPRLLKEFHEHLSDTSSATS